VTQGKIEGERKQVTVLFADVRGSMDLAERTEPEEFQALMGRLFAILSGGVHRFGGTVDKFTGDGIMALFGAPVAHEDHARRACYAALHLRDELAEFAAELRRSRGLDLLVRMGLNSGEVVVGSIGDEQEPVYTAVGRTVGLAQRMEQLAQPGTTCLTDATAKLVEGYVTLTDLGTFDVRGVSGSVRVYELGRVGPVRRPIELSRSRGFSRFVGRAEEMHELEAALDSAIAGEGQIIGVTGEPGVGKSRLCHEFSERCRSHGLAVYEAQGHAHTRSIPFHPVLELARSYFGIGEGDSDRAARERIRGKLALIDVDVGDDLPLLFEFLSVPDPASPAPPLDPSQRQQRLLGLVTRVTRAQNQREPVVVVLEDLHLVDRGTELFLGALVEAVPAAGGLTVVSFRPEYRAGWMARSYYCQIPVVPLGAAAIAAMLADLLGPDGSLDGLRELIAERVAGNPFFVEELIQSLVEAGHLEGSRGSYRLARAVDHAALPASVIAVLGARIDCLSERDKTVLQTAAVIGREFAQPVLAAATGLAERQLEAALDELLAAGYVYRQALYPQPEYAFEHPLTRDVAYGSLLGERRASAHAAVARAIEEQSGDRLEERSAVIAHHYEQAGSERRRLAGLQ
jgi:class 3 adenylate cyclase/DNA-binding IscR family transcriptional regulator